jgi:hypothetical protein
MLEQTRQRQRTAVRPSTGGGLGDVFGGDAFSSNAATVVHGVHRESTAANQTVGEIRRRMRDRLAIDDRSHAFINGRSVTDDTRVQPGQTVSFMRKAGEKGARRP